MNINLILTNVIVMTSATKSPLDKAPIAASWAGAAKITMVDNIEAKISISIAP